MSRQAFVRVRDYGRDTSWVCEPCSEGGGGFGSNDAAARREVGLHNLLHHAPPLVQRAAALLEVHLAGLVTAPDVRRALSAAHWWGDR